MREPTSQLLENLGLIFFYENITTKNLQSGKLMPKIL